MPDAQCSKDPFYSFGEGGGRVENGGGGVRRGVREGLGVCD